MVEVGAQRQLVHAVAARANMQSILVAMMKVLEFQQTAAVYSFTVSSRCRRRRLHYRNSIRSRESFPDTLFKRLFKAVALLVLFRGTVLFKRRSVALGKRAIK